MQAGVRTPRLEAVAEPARAPATKATPPAEPHGWRRWLPWALVVVATIIALISALNVWVKRQALDTNNWTNASERLLENSEIRNALSVYIVDQIYQNVDVPAALEQRLPPQQRGLAAPIAGALQPAAIRLTDAILARPAVQRLWKEANRRAHQLLIALLDGKHNVLQSTNGNVVLDLHALVAEVADETGIGTRLEQRLPAEAGQIVILKGNQLDTARKTVKVVRVLSYFLFFLVIGLYALAIYLAPGRRRTLLLAAGIGVIIVGFLILVVRRYAGTYIVDSLTTNPDAKDAVSATWAIGTELLRNVGINALVYGIAIVFAAWIAGPTRPATWSRRELAPVMRERPYIIYGVVTLLLFIILLAGPTDSQRVIPLLILFVFAYIGTEVLRRQTMQEFPPPDGAVTPVA
jgi:hypothetical protein